MISTMPKHPSPHKESRFAVDGLLTEGNVTVFIYYRMHSSIYHDTCEHIKLERSRPFLWCSPVLLASLNNLMAMLIS